MLINKRAGNTVTSDFDSIHNYYEHLVFEKLIQKMNLGVLEEEFITDIACVALNHLPPRYIRHDVDMAFYLSPNEYEEIDQKVANAIEYAISFVQEKENQAASKAANV